MKRFFGAIFCACLLSGTAHATLFDWQTIGNTGNSPSSEGFGQVNYEYKIGTYEVTNDEYANFLNTVAKSDPNGLYSDLMNTSSRGGIIRSGSSGSYTYSVKSGYEQKPVTYVNWYDSARYVNWLANGMTSIPSSTESGTYLFTAQFVVQQVGSSTFRQPNSVVFLPSADEWYKAAFYDPDTGVYFTYAISDDFITTADANYDDYPNGEPTVVGSYGIESPYGTFDQNGNVWEWCDTIIETSGGGDDRDVFGGGWSSAEFWLANDATDSGQYFDPAVDREHLGIRLASKVEFDSEPPIPEPTTILLCLIGAILAAMRKRK